MEVSEKQFISILCEKNVHASSGSPNYIIYLKITSFSTVLAFSGINLFILVDTQNIPFDLARAQLFTTMAASCLCVPCCLHAIFFKATMNLCTHVPNSVFSSAILQHRINSTHYERLLGIH